MNGSQAGDTGSHRVIREELSSKLTCAERPKEVVWAHGDLGEPSPMHGPEAGGNVTGLQGGQCGRRSKSHAQSALGARP